MPRESGMGCYVCERLVFFLEGRVGAFLIHATHTVWSNGNGSPQKTTPLVALPWACLCEYLCVGNQLM